MRTASAAGPFWLVAKIGTIARTEFKNG